MHYKKGFSCYYISFLFFLSITLLPPVPARNIPAVVTTNILSVNPNTNHTLSEFLDTGRGSDVVGLSELKKYFHRFGYLPTTDTNFTDNFDEQLESAVTLYQSKLGLPETGRLDSATLSQVMSPRCGVPDQSHDDHNKLHTAKHYSFLKGRPSWNHSIVPLMLNYALSQERIIDYINISDIRVALERAFSTWSSVIPVDFTETRDYEHANITIGFYYGDHGDGDPFHDRVLGHATGPGPGAHLHFNAAKTWAVDFNSEKSKNAYYDLESTAVHEIGHLLGLDHSNISKAIMWPYGGAREKHVDLSLDDVNGAQALYGANPNFKLDSLNRKQAVASSESSSFGLREVIICLVVKALFLV